jgi:hypothetical protein
MLQDAGVEVTEVAKYTGFPEIMNGEDVTPQNSWRALRTAFGRGAYATNERPRDCAH